MVAVFADSKKALDDTLHFLKCYALANKEPPKKPFSPDLCSRGALTAEFGRALTSKRPLDATPARDSLMDRMIFYLRKPREEIDALFLSSPSPMIAMPPRPTMEGTLYEVSISLSAENLLLDHYLLSQGMFMVRGEGRNAAIYSSIDLAAQKTNRHDVRAKVAEIVSRNADPFDGVDFPEQRYN